MRKHSGRAVAHLIIELAADHQHGIGLRHRRRAHRPDKRRMLGGHQAATFLRVEIERAARVQQADKLGARAARPAPGHHQRPLGAPEHIDRLGDTGRIGLNAARGSRVIHSSSTSCGGTVVRRTSVGIPR